jgi:MFS family permease
MSTPMTHSIGAAPSADARRPMLVALSLLALFLAAMDSTVVGTLLPVMKAQMQDEALFPWLMSSFILTSVLATPLTGRLADALGEKTAMLGALAIFLVGSLAVWHAQTMWGLIGARALQGVGAGAVSVMTYIVIGRLFDEAGRAKMQGLLSLVWGVAAILGPLLGALIDREWGWRMVFLLNVPACVLIMALLAALYPARTQKPAQQAPLDVLTTLSFVGALGAALTLIMAGSLELGVEQTGILGGVLLACLLVQVWRVRAEPGRSLIPLAFLTQRRYVLPALHTVMASITLYAAVTLLPLYLHGHGEAGSSVEGGVLVMAAALGWVVGAAVCGGLLAKLGFRAAAFVGSVFLALGALGLSQASAHLLIGASLACIGLGIGFVATSSLVLVQNQSPLTQLGSYTSAIHLCRNAGAALGINTVAALQIAAWRQLSQTGGADAWRQSFAHSFGFLVALTVLACVLAIWIPSRAERDNQEPKQGHKA